MNVSTLTSTLALNQTKKSGGKGRREGGIRYQVAIPYSFLEKAQICAKSKPKELEFVERIRQKMAGGSKMEATGNFPQV